MTLEELLDLDPDEIASMTDEQWKPILTPFLPLTRPEQAAKTSKPVTKVKTTQVVSSAAKKKLDVNTTLRISMRRMELVTKGLSDDNVKIQLRTEFAAYDLTTLGL